MKVSKLLVLSALFAFTANNAKAGVPDGPWVMPEPQGLEFTTFTVDVDDPDAHHFYLYNPGAKMFFASGNSWNTQASARVYGYDFWLQTATEDGAPEGTYELWNYVNNPQRSDVTGNHNVFFDGGSYWVDHGTQAGYTWNYYIVDGAVRFEVVTNPGKYIGWDGTYIDSDDASATCSSVLKCLDPATEGFCVDWKAVTVDSYEAFLSSDGYEAYCEGAKLYIASLGLKKALQDADAIGLDCTASTAVYTSGESTIAELRAAANLVNARIALKKAIDAAKDIYIDTSSAEATLANEASTVNQVNTATNTLTELTAAKNTLKALIEECEAKGYTDTADAKAVLQNPSATKAEVEAATKALSDAYTEWGKTQATVESPADLSGMLVNPNFDNASNAGWSGTAPNMTGSGSHGPANVAEQWNKNFDTYQDVEGLPAGIYTLSAQAGWRSSIEDWRAGKTGSKVYVKIGEVETSTPFICMWAPMNTTPLAGETSWGVNAGETSGVDPETGETFYIPNDPSCFRVYAEKGWYDTKMLFKVSAGDKVRVGVALPTRVSGDDWSCFDTFALTFYGDGADAWQKYIDEAWNYEPLELDEDEVLFTQAYLDAYNEAVSVDPSTLTGDAVKSAVLAVENAYTLLQENIALWKEWKDAVEKARNRVADLGWTDPWTMTDGVGDYLYDADDIEVDRELTNAELEVEIAKIADLIAQCEKFAKENLKPGQDVTFYIKNAGFEEGISSATNPSGLTASGDNNDDGSYGTAEGWHADKTRKGNFTPGPLGSDLDQLMISAIGKTNHCFEAWHCWGFDLWQEVNDLPAGVYQLDVQGYVRNEGDATTIPVKLYLNNMMTDFAEVYSEQVSAEHFLTNAAGNDSLPIIESWSWTDTWYPNSMGAASLCFEWGMYKKSAFGLVQEGQPMRIGVKSVDMNSHWWCIWDNFKLTYQGFLPKYVKDALKEAVAAIDIEGKLIGSDVRAKAEDLLDKAQVYLDDTEHGDDDTAWGKEMYNLLNDIYDIVPVVSASEALFVQLSDALIDLENALYDAVASQAVQNEAAALKDQVEEGIFNETFTDAEAKALLEKIKGMITTLALPDYSTASDATPVDLTAAIKSASFEAIDEYDEKTNSSAGWTNPCNLGNEPNDSWNPHDQRLVFAMEQWHANIDMYQDIVGLPAGTYLLQIDAFCEISGASSTQDRAADSYKAWVEKPNYSEAFLYGTDGEGVTYSTPIANLAKAAPKEKPAFESDIDDVQAALDSEVVEVTLNEETYYWPTSLISGRYFLELGKNGGIDGAYTNKVILKVKEDGKLRVGLKAEHMTDKHWVVWDDFRLFYYGANSSKGVSDNPLSVESITAAQPVKVEFFTLDGRKVNSLQKGIMIQKVTLENGAVIVRKVRK